MDPKDWTAPAGLTSEEASRRLREAGRNELPPPTPDPWWLRLVRQLAEPMSILLFVAAAVAGIGLNERIDAVAILAIVALNAAIGMAQEGKAARELDALRALGAPEATVLRDGAPRVVDAREVVPGDVVVLAAGDRVPADLHLVEATALEIDESVVSGESLPVAKTPGPETDGTLDRSAMALAGTHVIHGSAQGVVTATGEASTLGRIASLLDRRQPATPLQLELRRLTGTLGTISIAIALGVFGLILIRTGISEGGLQEAFLSAVALAVAAVPEGLATVVTVALAIGVRRMAAGGAIVRRLPAVETLGSATAILTDKTGTLTENALRVEGVSIAGASPLPLPGLPIEDDVAEAIALCSDATLEPATGGALEVGLLEAVGADRVRAIRAASRRVGAVPFDAARRSMATVQTVAGDSGGTGLALFVKGAPEVIVDRCVSVLAPDRSVLPLEGRRERTLGQASRMATRGIRTLALARRTLTDVPDDPSSEEHDLVLLGFVGLRDPVRSDAEQAVREAAAAGIRVVMVTGDHPGTATAIAEEVGILRAGDPVLTGDDLQRDGIPPEPLDVPVYARVAPEQKLALVERATADGQVVAVTGDGVNDAPALRRAAIGVAMGRSGSDVAREASDMIITDDDLLTIVEAVREGRAIYANIRKVVDYLVAGNLSEITVVVGSLLLFPALGIPLLPLQLLWINLLTDGFPALALGVDPPDPLAMTRPPRRPTERILDAAGLRLLLLRALLIAAASIGSIAISRFLLDTSWAEARTVMFSVLVIAHLLYALAVRGGDRGHIRPRARDLVSNPWLILAIATGLLLQIAIVVWPVAGEVFDTVRLDLVDWLLVAIGAVAPLLCMLAVARREER